MVMSCGLMVGNPPSFSVRALGCSHTRQMPDSRTGNILFFPRNTLQIPPVGCRYRTFITIQMVVFSHVLLSSTSSHFWADGLPIIWINDVELIDGFHQRRPALLFTRGLRLRPLPAGQKCLWSFGVWLNQKRDIMFQIFTEYYNHFPAVYLFSVWFSVMPTITKVRNIELLTMWHFCHIFNAF